MTALPSLFLAHGAPDLPLTDHPANRFLKSLPACLPTPVAILVISGHWEEAIPTIGTAAAPETIHDFHGFPAPLYELTYQAKTDTSLAERVVELMSAGGLPVTRNPSRGYDHGAWVPLMLAFPAADIPVVQLALQRQGDAARHFAIGEALAPLRQEGVLIVGSGATVHNLREISAEGTPPPAFARSFDAWLDRRLDKRDQAGLLRFPNEPAEADQAHPTIEHFLPFFMALGAGWSGGTHRCLHQSYSYGSIGMTSYAFGSAAEVRGIPEAA